MAADGFGDTVSLAQKVNNALDSVIASEGNTVLVLWGEGNATGGLEIFNAYSTDAGANWAVNFVASYENAPGFVNPFVLDAEVINGEGHTFWLTDFVDEFGSFESSIAWQMRPIGANPDVLPTAIGSSTSPLFAIADCIVE